MIVRCENCQTEFALDDSQVPADGVQVRCSVCSHVFHVDPPLGSVQEQPWQIRTTDDLLFTAPDLRVLEEWIRDGRLHPQDEVSRTGNAWLRLGDMPEFAQLFSGFGGLPSVLKPVESALPDRKPDAESSAALKLLGPPPEFDERAESAPTGTFSREKEGEVGAPTATFARPGKATHSPASGIRLPPDLIKRAEDEDAATIPRDPKPVSESKPRATMSMLGAATEVAVRPVTRPPGERSGPAPQASPAPAIEVAPPRSEPVEVDVESEPVHKRSSWGVWALIGVLVPIGVVFGVPQIRAQAFALMGIGEQDPAVAGGEEGEAPKELKQAQQALRTLGEADMAAADAAIQRAIDEGAEGAALGQLELARVDLLASRSLSHKMAASVAAEPAALEAEAEKELTRARTLFESISDSAPKGDPLVVARAKLRLAEGRPVAEIAALLPESAKEERLITRLAPVWRDKVPGEADVVSQLDTLPPQTALGRSALALARHQANEPEKARGVALTLHGLADDQPVANALLEAMGEAPPAGDPTGETGEVIDEEGGDIIEDPIEAGEGGDAPPVVAGTGPKKGGGGGGGGGGGSRLDKLIDKGCGQIKSDAAAANKTLLKAFDIAPANLEVLTCLGDANMKLGKAHRALVFYEKILDRSSNHVAGLKGAARASKKIGSKGDALAYYKRVLDIDKNNSEAKKYVEGQEGGGGGGNGGGGSKGGDTGGTGTGGTEGKWPGGGEQPDPPKDTPKLEGDPG